MSVSLQALTGWPFAVAGPVVYALHPEDGPEVELGPSDHVPQDNTQASWPIPPAVHPPPPEVGRIVWPCWGATRWAVGHLLVRGEDLSTLRAVSGWLGRVRVTLDDGLGGTPAALDMTVSAARPVADPRAEAESGVSDDHLYLLTLTDRRGAAYRHWGPLGTPSGVSWGDVIMPSMTNVVTTTQTVSDVNTLLTAGGFTPAYPNPVFAVGGNNTANWWDWSGTDRDDHYGVYIDAACAQVNLRLAVLGDGSGQVQSAATAAAAFESWWQSYGRRCESGGLIDAAAEWPGVLLWFFLGRNNDAASEAFASPVGGSRVREIPAGLSYTNVNQLVKLTVRVPTQATGANGVDLMDRYRDDVERWLAAGAADCTLAGFPPLPGSAVPCWAVYDTHLGKTRLARPNAWWPWPLNGRVKLRP